MRTSGASSTDGLLFVFPAVIFIGFFVWASGGTVGTLAEVDQFLRRAAIAVVSWIAALW